MRVDEFNATSPTIDALEQALEGAGRDGRHLLIRLAGVAAAPDAIQMLAVELERDPCFGAAIPRVLAPDGRVRPLVDGAGEDSYDRAILAHLPARYLSTELLAPCVLIRTEVAANFCPLDRRFSSMAGALLDLLCRARRAGFRTVVVNHAAVDTNTRASVQPQLPRADRDRLIELYPERDGGARDLGPEPIARDEAVAATMPAHRGDPSLLLDLGNVAAQFNGTSYAAISIAQALHDGPWSWPVEVATNEAAAEFHRLAGRFPKWSVRTAAPSRAHTIGLRLSQPWHVNELVRLHRSTLFNVFLVFDTIAWDTACLGPIEIEPVWRSMASSADALMFISRFSRDRFETRFGKSAHGRHEVSLLSCDPADYRRSTAQSVPGSLLLVGNAYDHKHVNRTAELLVRAFPYAPITAIGATSAPSRVQRRASGQITDGEMHDLYAASDLVIVPSFYEGFGLPIVTGLAYGRTVIARRSPLLQEIAREIGAGGRLVDFATPEELVDRIGLLLHGRPVPTIAPALPVGKTPRNWTRVAADIVGVLESLVSAASTAPWQRRREVLPFVSSTAETWP